MQNSWRMVVGKDRKLYFSHRGDGSVADNKHVMVLHTDGSIHFHERVVFRGSFGKSKPKHNNLS